MRPALSATADASAKPSPWLVSPTVDLALLVATPLVIVPVVTLAATVASPEFIFLMVAAFASIGHHLPGFLRAYGDRELFRRFRWRFLLAPPVALAVALTFALRGLHGLELVLLLWATWHIMMQTYGFLRIYDMKAGRRDAISAWLGFALCSVIFLAGIVFSDARVFGMAETLLRIGLPVPDAGGLQVLRWGVGIVSAVTICAYVVHEVRSGWSGVNPIKLLLLLSTAWLYWTCGSVTTNLLVGVAMFEVFHALQYYAIVWTYNRRQADRAGGSFGPLGFLFRNRWYLLVVYCVLIALFGSLRLVPEGLHEQHMRTILLAILAASTLLHFYYDGFIWKVRERKTQHNLGIDSQAGAAPEKSGAIGHALRCAVAVGIIGVLLWAEGAGTVGSQEQQLARLSELTPDLPELQVRMGQQYLAEGDVASALDWAKQAVELRPRSHEAQATAGLAWLHSGEFARAAEHLKIATELAPHSWENHFDLAQAHARLDQWSQADDAFAAAAKLQPQREEIRLAWGEMLLRQGEVDRALAQLRVAEELAPASITIQLALIEALTAGREHDVALRRAEQLVAKQPESYEAQLCLGQLHAQSGRWEKAAACFETAVSMQPDAAEAHYQLGLARVQLGEYSRAMQSLQQAIELQANHGEAHFQLGNAYFIDGKLELARKSYERSLELLPDVADAHMNLGSVLLQLDELDSAVESYRAALRLQPHNGQGHYNLGLALIQQNKLPEARKHIRAAEDQGISPSQEVVTFLELN